MTRETIRPKKIGFLTFVVIRLTQREREREPVIYIYIYKGAWWSFSSQNLFFF